MIIIIITILVGIPMLILAAILLSGRGASLISGFNMLSKAQQDQYDKKRLCRFFGKLMLATLACMAILLLGTQFSLTWLMYAGIILIVVIPIGSLIYARGYKRFLKKDADMAILAARRKLGKVQTIIIFAVTGAILIGLGVMFTLGEREPSVDVFDDGIRIRAMYGLSVDFSEITDIVLLDQSMREIGTGMRLNGYGGAALKGHFTAGLLFVRPNSSPTIRIERRHGSDIFISFRDNLRTEMLYRELTLVMLP